MYREYSLLELDACAAGNKLGSTSGRLNGGLFLAVPINGFLVAEVENA